MRGTSFCRGCGNNLSEPVLSLGKQPLSNGLINLSCNQEAPVWPLEFRVCDKCGLGQIGEFVNPSEIFEDYTYFSSASSSWLQHANRFVQESIIKYGMNSSDLVIEIASNDGYLLKYFVEQNIPVLGIEPAANVAEYAIKNGIPTKIAFFGEEIARQLISDGKIPKLVICNNVLAHVPDIQDFLKGLSHFVAAGSIITIEAPSMLQMLEKNYFDTIYHEHFSYLSATSLEFLAQQAGMKLIDIEWLESHGGSYRYVLGKSDIEPTFEVKKSIEFEKQAGMLDQLYLAKFAQNSLKAIEQFRAWCVQREGKISGFGAAAKATVLLNASGIQENQISAVVDSSFSKQGKLIPGVKIPVISPSELIEHPNDYVVIFPWNIAHEIANQILELLPNFHGEIWTTLPTMQKLK